MARRRYIPALALLGLTASSMPTALAASKQKPTTVHVQRSPSATGNITIGFHPRQQLPTGGYYYAVLVLGKHYAKRFASAPCAKASNMSYTEYGYPTPGKPVTLRVGSERSGASPLRWCQGASYNGAIYAIPHPPPCGRYEPCYGHTTAPECYESEPRCVEGKRRPFYGVVAHQIHHPGELPQPTDRSARIVAYFQVRFP